MFAISFKLLLTGFLLFFVFGGLLSKMYEDPSWMEPPSWVRNIFVSGAVGGCVIMFISIIVFIWSI